MAVSPLSLRRNSGGSSSPFSSPPHSYLHFPFFSFTSDPFTYGWPFLFSPGIDAGLQGVIFYLFHSRPMETVRFLSPASARSSIAFPSLSSPAMPRPADGFFFYTFSGPNGGGFSPSPIFKRIPPLLFSLFSSVLTLQPARAFFLFSRDGAVLGALFFFPSLP